MRKLDITGQRYGRLVVVKPLETINKITRWLCKCDCGNEVAVATRSLRTGYTRSCGCLHTEIRKKQHFKHGMTGSRLYYIWQGMKRRCYNKNSQKYHLYGGRGITVCEKWRSDFEEFYQWSISNGYKNGLTIDRINNKEGYSPSNCRWVTQADQTRNTCRNHWLSFNGKTMVLQDWAKEYNMSAVTLLKRLKKYDIETALTMQKPEHGGKPNILCGLNGEEDTILGWSKKLGVSRTTIRNRIRDYGKENAILELQKSGQVC